MSGADTRDSRPSPDALLKAAQRESGRGRLKIFLGAAPGVGKTYEMLTTAQARRREGLDVVVGVVETHGRRETEALLDGLEVLPRRRSDYKGRMLEEMDLDALLGARIETGRCTRSAKACSSPLHGGPVRRATLKLQPQDLSRPSHRHSLGRHRSPLSARRETDRSPAQ